MGNLFLSVTLVAVIPPRFAILDFIGDSGSGPFLAIGDMIISKMLLTKDIGWNIY